MPRFLWLVDERLPHPDAVSYPAHETDLQLVLELFALPYVSRIRLAEQLQNFLRDQATRPVFCRQRVPCRRPSGLYHLVPWRLAKWLASVLRAGEPVILRTTSRIRHWLDNSAQPQIVGPTQMTG